MKLIFKQKIFKLLDSYDVFDEEGQVQFHVEQSPGLFRSLTVTDSHGMFVFAFVEKGWSFVRKFQMTFANGQELLMQGKLFSFRPRFSIEDQDGSIEVVGSIGWRSFSIMREGKSLGAIEKHFSIADCFEITAIQDADLPLLLAIALAIDTSIDHSG